MRTVRREGIDARDRPFTVVGPLCNARASGKVEGQGFCGSDTEHRIGVRNGDRRRAAHGGDGSGRGVRAGFRMIQEVAFPDPVTNKLEVSLGRTLAG